MLTQAEFSAGPTNLILIEFEVHERWRSRVRGALLSTTTLKKMSTAKNMLGSKTVHVEACKEGDVYSNCYDVVALRRIVAAATALSKCNYWLGAALQHIDSPDDFL